MLPTCNPAAEPWNLARSSSARKFGIKIQSKETDKERDTLLKCRGGFSGQEGCICISSFLEEGQGQKPQGGQHYRKSKKVRHFQKEKKMTTSIAYNFFFLSLFQKFPLRLGVSDVDIGFRELTRKVIRRGIPPHAPPSGPGAGSDERRLCLLPDPSNFCNKDHPRLICYN